MRNCKIICKLANTDLRLLLFKNVLLEAAIFLHFQRMWKDIVKLIRFSFELRNRRLYEVLHLIAFVCYIVTFILEIFVSYELNISTANIFDDTKR